MPPVKNTSLPPAWTQRCHQNHRIKIRFSLPFRYPLSPQSPQSHGWGGGEDGRALTPPAAGGRPARRSHVTAARLPRAPARGAAPPLPTPGTRAGRLAGTLRPLGGGEHGGTQGPSARLRSAPGPASREGLMACPSIDTRVLECI